MEKDSRYKAAGICIMHALRVASLASAIRRSSDSLSSLTERCSKRMPLLVVTSKRTGTYTNGWMQNNRRLLEELRACERNRQWRTCAWRIRN
jgi:hypothetical protein